MSDSDQTYRDAGFGQSLRTPSARPATAASETDPFRTPRGASRKGVPCETFSIMAAVGVKPVFESDLTFANRDSHRAVGMMIV